MQIKTKEPSNHSKIAAGSSISFSQKIWKGKHVVDFENTTIAMEFRTKTERNKEPVAEINKTNLIPILKEWLKQMYSFLRKNMNQNQIQKKILFLDAEFTCKNQDGEKSPVAVTILDYTGRIVLDEKVCPRQQVLQVGTRFHGIREKDLRCKEDEYKILKKIQQIVRGKILIGHDLAQDLKYLKIKPDNIFGIRDMSTSLALEKIGLTRKGQFYKLSAIAKGSSEP